MPNTNPTIVSASLSDKELQDSINNMVANFDKGLQTMLEHSNEYVGKIQESLQKIGNTNFGAKGSNDGGVAKQTKAQNEFTDVVKKSTNEIKKQNQEAATSFDNFAKAQQVAIRSASPSGIRNADTLQTMNIQLDLLRERLREARQQYSSFVALAAHATTTGDKGLFQYATDGVHRYEQEVRNLIPQIRTLQSGIQQMGDVIAPQGHTIQNYVNSLQKANPELAALNAQYKSGTSLLQDQNVSYSSATGAVSRYTEAIRKQAQAIRESRDWQEKGRVVSGDTVFYDPERANVSKRDKQLLLSLEEQIVQAQQNEAEAARRATQETRNQAQAQQQVQQAATGTARIIESVHEMQRRSANFQKGNASVQTFTIELESAKRLSDRLKELREQYNNMSFGQRFRKEGQAIAQQIREITRQGQILNNQLNRPTKKEVFGLSEKTLDDMAYKLRQLQSYKMGLNVKTQVDEMKQVDKEIVSLKKRYDELMSKNQQMIASNTALGRSWNYMKNRLAFYFTVGASTSFIKNLIEVRSQYEMNERALGILINSAERGTQIFNELSQMALVSPYTLIELSTAAKQLTAYDIAAKDVVDTTRRLADMASAVGIPIERLTYALGQIKAYGYLNSRDARMFANAGIPLVKQLSDYYTQLEGRLVSTADVYDRIKKKTIDYEQVVQVINKMTDEGGKFFDFQAKMADTLKVRLAYLTLAWNNMLNDMGSSNQGVLTTGIGLLRDMFLHWKDLESAISKVATAFGIYKTAQLVTLIWTGRITTAMGVQELVGKKLQARFASLTISQKGFVSAATAGWAALAFIVADAWLTISRNMEEIEQLNKSIADGAKESYEAIDKMLHSSEMVSTRLSAAQGKLSDTDAAKAWEMLREQIELSAASSKELTAQLLKEPDINKRVTESFNLAEKIEDANRKLSDLNDSLDVSQNSILGGLFGEGLAEDIDDYNARLKYTSDAAEWAAKKNKGFWENAAMGLRALFNEVKDAFGSDANEAQDEIKNFAQKAAQTIKDELGEEGIKDKIQVNEAIARVVRGMEQQFPQIRGKGKVLFETIFYDTMANEFKGAVDSQAYYYEKFLEQLKKDHASAFSGVTEDINKETFKWSSAQIDAIQKTADKVKKDLPAASQGAIDEILRQLNSTDFKVRIVAEMATTSLDNVQKQFREKFIEKPWIANDKEREKAENEANQRYGTLMRKNTESNAEYEKRISDEKKKQLELSQRNADIITKNKEKQDEFSKSVLADAQKQKEAADDWLKAAKDIEDKGGYDFSTKAENSAARKAAKQAESELAKALKEELSTIDKVRSIYKDLTKEGMSHANAVERATKGWDETVNAINRVLQKNGLQKLDLSKFAGIENPRELVNMLQSQLNTLLKRGAKPAEIKELQTKVNTLEVDADKYDLTKITKGLNNELGKLKDEYELAIELDANPELGDMFADMFGINTSTLPKTFGDALDRAQIIINRKLAEMNITTPFDLMEGNIDSFAKSTGLDKDGAVIKELVSAQNAYRDMFKKNITETEKMLDDYIKKYGDYSDKIAEIEAGRLEKLKKLNEAYYTEEMRKRPEYTAKLNAIEQGANKEKQQVDFDEFKNSRYYTMMFENLDYISTKTIRDMRDRVRELMDTMNDLTPEQLKTLVSQYEKLEQKLVKRSPFKTLTKDLNEYFSTSKERKAANQEFKNAQKEYDVQKKNVAALKEKYEQAKANTNTSKSYLNFLQIEIDGENEILKILKEQLEAAQKKADKYNLIKKLALEEASQVAQVVSSNLQSLGELRDFLQQDLDIELSDELNGLVDGLSKVGQGINKITSSATSGDIVGVITGIGQTIYGLYDGIASIFGGGSASDKKITKQIQESERAVKRLELAYKDLEDAVNNAYGASTSGAKRAALANKQLQLAEIKRQIQLEKSRDSKDRDEDKILELEAQYKDMLLEIKNGVADIANEMLGISSVGDGITSIVEAMIDAFRNGEDAMEAFSKKWDEMIDSMILKLIVSQYMQKAWDNVMKTLNEKEEEFLAKSAQDKADAESELTKYNLIGDRRKQVAAYAKSVGASWEGYLVEVSDNAYDEWAKKYDEYINSLIKKIDSANTAAEKSSEEYLKWSLDYMMGEGRDYMTGVGQNLADALGEWYTFGQDSDKNLSALQQGISQISETTANALEAYMNSVNQQVYYHSSLLEQIRDSVVGLDLDVSLGVQSQMLLQLQNSYQTQQAIQQILEGVLVPSGRAFAVELMS